MSLRISNSRNMTSHLLIEQLTGVSLLVKECTYPTYTLLAILINNNDSCRNKGNHEITV